MSSYASKAFESIGIPPAQDFSSGYLSGAQYTPATISSPDEERSSSESSFLRTATGRANLKVYTRTLAKRILFDKHKTANGVLVQSNGTTTTLNAKREVILSAGSVSSRDNPLNIKDAHLDQYQSPQLLMVSGIGPKATLDKFSIPVVEVREGVGQNLWDQPSLSIFQQTDVETLSGLSDPSKAAAAALLYDTNRTGILTSSGADFFGKFETSNLSHAVTAMHLFRYRPPQPKNSRAISTSLTAPVT